MNEFELAGMTAEQRERYMQQALGRQGEVWRGDRDAMLNVYAVPHLDCSRFWDAVGAAVVVHGLEQLCTFAMLADLEEP